MSRVDVMVKLAAVDNATPVIRRRLLSELSVLEEAVDGPRWSEALQEGRRLRERAAIDRCDRYGRWRGRRAIVHCENVRPSELSGGIPVGWWGRP